MNGLVGKVDEAIARGPHVVCARQGSPGVMEVWGCEGHLSQRVWSLENDWIQKEKYNSTDKVEEGIPG